MSGKKNPIYLVYQGMPPGRLDIKTMPFGLLYVGQALREAGYRVRIFHLQGYEDESLVKAVKSERPLFVGFSNFVSPLLRYDIDNSRWLHEQGIKVVWGGIFSTAMPEVVLRSGWVDYVVAGEGERSAVALADAIASAERPRGIPGVGYREGEEIIFEPPSPPAQDLDQFRMGLDLLDVGRYVRTSPDRRTRTLHVPFSRGCPFSCSFCYNSMNTRRGRWSAHGPEYMKELLIPLRDRYGVDVFVFTCDNPFGKVARARSIIGELGVRWRTAAHLLAINPEFLDWAVQSGCAGLSFGIESGSDRTLARMNKHITREIIRERLGLCREKHLATLSSWIGMVPGETVEELRETLTLMDEIYESDPRHGMKFQIFMMFPHTTFWQEAISQGFRAPASLEEWGQYQRLTYPLLGYSHRQAQWTAFITNATYSQDRSYPRIRSPLLRYFLRSQIKRAPISEPLMRALETAQGANQLFKRLRPAKNPAPTAGSFA